MGWIGRVSRDFLSGIGFLLGKFSGLLDGAGAPSLLLEALGFCFVLPLFTFKSLHFSADLEGGFGLIGVIVVGGEVIAGCREQSGEKEQGYITIPCLLGKRRLHSRPF